MLQRLCAMTWSFEGLTVEPVRTLCFSTYDVLRFMCAQLESRNLGFRSHAVAFYNKRIYDAAEDASMPLEKDWLDRCVRSNRTDTDVVECCP